VKVDRNRLAVGLTIATAFAWPLGQLNYIPFVGVGALEVLTVPFVLLLALDLANGQKFRVPFEILAPSGVILVVLLVDAMRSSGPARFRTVLTATILGAAIAHLARNRELVRHALWASTLSGSAVALLSLLTPALDLMPTAFGLHSDVSLTFAQGLPEGFHVLALVACVALYLSTEETRRPMRRIVGGLGAGLIGMLFVDRTLRWFNATRAAPFGDYAGADGLDLLALGLVVWLLIRIAAKEGVVAKDRRWPGLWWGMVVCTVVFLALTPLEPDIHYGVLPGLALGAALPAGPRVAVSRWVWLSALPFVPLAALNLFHVDPQNLDDPRQYDAAAREDFRNGRYGSVLARMNQIDHYVVYDEPRADLWRARVALAAGRYNWASFAFRDAVPAASSRTLLPPPTLREEQDFLVLIRDALTPLSDERTVCSYERVLLACGERDAALYSLQLRAGIALAHTDADLAQPFARIVAMILGDPDLVSEFETWETGNLLTLLVQWGARLERDSSSNGLLLLAAQRTPKTLNIHVTTDEFSDSSTVPLAPPGPETLIELDTTEDLYWSEAGDARRYALMARTSRGVRRVGLVTVTPEDGVAFALADAPPPIPFVPALRFRLSE